MRVVTVVRWQNDMVMVFDEAGQQIPALQGLYREVKALVLQHCEPDRVRFQHGDWDTKGLREVEAKQW